MDIKQRLVGAIVLVALAIIFIPMLLEKPHEETASITLKPVPDAPEVPRFTLEEVRVPASSAGAEDDSMDVLVDDPEPSSRRSTSAIEASAETGGSVAEEEEAASLAPGSSPAPGPASAPASTPSTTTANRAPASGVPAYRLEEVPPRAAAETANAVRIPESPGWVVQIGTFKNRTSALRIRDELINDRIGGFTQEIRAANGEALLRVYAGPFVNREAAEKARSTVDQRYKVKALVTQFKPAD